MRSGAALSSNLTATRCPGAVSLPQASLAATAGRQALSTAATAATPQPSNPRYALSHTAASSQLNGNPVQEQQQQKPPLSRCGCSCACRCGWYAQPPPHPSAPTNLHPPQWPQLPVSHLRGIPLLPRLSPGG